MTSTTQLITEAMFRCLRASLEEGWGLVRLPPIVEPMPAVALADELRSMGALVGMPGADGRVLRRRDVTGSVEQIIAWRNDSSRTNPIVIIGDLDHERASGLADVDCIRSRDVRDTLVADLFSRHDASPGARSTLRALAATEDVVRTEELAALVSDLSRADDLDMSLAEGLWRVGLLSDTDLDEAGVRRNAALVARLRSVDAATVTRMVAHAGADRARYRQLRRFASTGRVEELAGLAQRNVAEALISASSSSTSDIRTRPDSPENTTEPANLHVDEETLLNALLNADGSSLTIGDRELPWELDSDALAAELDDPAGHLVTADCLGLGVDGPLLVSVHRHDLPDEAQLQLDQLLDQRSRLLPLAVHLLRHGATLLANSERLRAACINLVQAHARLLERACLSKSRWLLDIDIRRRADGTALLLPLHPALLVARIAAAKHNHPDAPIEVALPVLQHTTDLVHIGWRTGLPLYGPPQPRHRVIDSRASADLLDAVVASQPMTRLGARVLLNGRAPAFGAACVDAVGDGRLGQLDLMVEDPVTIDAISQRLSELVDAERSGIDLRVRVRPPDPSAVAHLALTIPADELLVVVDGLATPDGSAELPRRRMLPDGYIEHIADQQLHQWASKRAALLQVPLAALKVADRSSDVTDRANWSAGVLAHDHSLLGHVGDDDQLPVGGPDIATVTTSLQDALNPSRWSSPLLRDGVHATLEALIKIRAGGAVDLWARTPKGRERVYRRLAFAAALTTAVDNERLLVALPAELRTSDDAEEALILDLGEHPLIEIVRAQAGRPDDLTAAAGEQRARRLLHHISESLDSPGTTSGETLRRQVGVAATRAHQNADQAVDALAKAATTATLLLVGGGDEAGPVPADGLNVIAVGEEWLLSQLGSDRLEPAVDPALLDDLAAVLGDL